MKLPRLAVFLLLALLPLVVGQAMAAQRNVVIFVADGLRYSSVTPETAPTMARVQREGVDFVNSHAMYPTLTTANASAIATGHYVGDTGNYANALNLDFPVGCLFGDPTPVVFLEDDCVLRATKDHYGSGYLGQTTLTEAARSAGYDTVIIGKKGPAAIQWIGSLKSGDNDVDGPLGIMIDDSTNVPKNLDGTPTMSTVLHGSLAADAIQATGATTPPFTSTPNYTQQAYLTSLTTQALIPDLKNSGKPFVLLFWSRDPDATQHNALDSDGRLVPGINSVDAHQAIYNADADLKAILDALKLNGMDRNTDVFVTADHGFSTIGKGIPTPGGKLGTSRLAAGFVALDVAKWLGNQNVYDPAHGNLQVMIDDGQRPEGGNAIIGPAPDKPMATVVTNGGTDFIYINEGPDKPANAKKVFDNLIQEAYVGGLFVNDKLVEAHERDFAGALRMSQINMIGAGGTPQPDIVISFRTFVAKGCKLGEQLCAVEIADTGLQTGQGMHGTFSRADTRNFMAAIGPDFKPHFKDTAPVSNADIAPTLAHILGIALTGPGTLKGRVVSEALPGGKMPVVSKRTVSAVPGAGGLTSVLNEQAVGATRYFDAAGIPGRVVGLSGR